MTTFSKIAALTFAGAMALSTAAYAGSHGSKSGAPEKAAKGSASGETMKKETKGSAAGDKAKAEEAAAKGSASGDAKKKEAKGSTSN